MAHNKKEVFYRLTEIGEMANRHIIISFYDKLTNRIPEKDLTAIQAFLDKWLETLIEYSEID